METQKTSNSQSSVERKNKAGDITLPHFLRIFIVLDIKFRSLIHFELIFACGVKQGSNFIVFHVDYRIFQHCRKACPFLMEWSWHTME